ncbi:TetR/AcrR family transcriptional regulator [Frankia sp. ArI3]|uniref:TetR/AcrR family transcriptional regulator n=1 Tax=Frankia sp. ArI3 TaxID=1858 RepID=UPI002107BF15|nr:TetR/AcrR family transcriptional regulator [Frankia sp. ArI3]
MSLRDVSAAAEVSRGTLYRYFKTKGELLTAISDHVRRGSAPRSTKRSPGSRSPPVASARSPTPSCTTETTIPRFPESSKRSPPSRWSSSAASSRPSWPR